MNQLKKGVTSNPEIEPLVLEASRETEQKETPEIAQPIAATTVRKTVNMGSTLNWVCGRLPSETMDANLGVC